MIRKDLKDFLKTIPEGVSVVAATKYGDENDIKELYNNGIFNIGENRVSSFLEKYSKLSELPINWHFIGHLQRNKAKLVANKIDFLHSLDSIELAKELDKLLDKPLNCFIEISINLEENKNGVPYFDAEKFISNLTCFKNIKVVGLMMMAKKDSTDKELNNQFQKLVNLRYSLEKSINISLPYLSMGMSNDYKIALKNSATHIRLGKILFSNYEK